MPGPARYTGGPAPRSDRLPMRLIRLLRKDIARETREWVHRDIVTADQARAICRLYGIDYDAALDRAGGYWLLVVLGNLFIGLAVLTLIGANWEEIPRGLRAGGLVAATVTAHGVALRAYAADRIARATALFLLGNCLYGCSIILVAQTYHLGEHMPDGVFWWALGSLPFGLLLASVALTLFAYLLGVVWFCLEFSLGFFPVLFPLFVVAGGHVLYRGRESSALFLVVIGGAVLWLEAGFAVLWSDASRRVEWHAEHVLLSLGVWILGQAAARWLARQPRARAVAYGRLLESWGLRLALVALLILSFEEPWRELAAARWDRLGSLAAALALLLSVSLWLAHRARSLPPVLARVAGLALPAVLVIAGGEQLSPIVFQVIGNIALVAMGVLLIRRGIEQRVGEWFYLGIGTILLTALLRYADLVGDYVGGALLFAILAAVLLGAARFWRRGAPSESPR